MTRIVERPSKPAITERLRAVCMALPEVTERLSHGEPTWFVCGKKSFVMSSDHHHDDRLGFWCAAPPGVQEEMVEREPDRFFRPPYVGTRGWLGVYLDLADLADIDWDEVAAIVTEAHRVVAPAKLVSLIEPR